MKNKTIGIIGNGLMGKGIAQVFANNGHKVLLFGRRAGFGVEVENYLRHEQKQERLSKEEFESIMNNLSFCSIVEDLCSISSLDVVIETVAEDREVKRNIFSSISNYLNDSAIVATNTSSMSVTELGSFVNKPERFLGLHFFSPVPMMDLVEVVKGLRTDDYTVEKALELMEGISKTAFVVVDSPGFVLNRMLVPMINEAVLLYWEYYRGRPEVIDEIMKKGMNLKVGPLKLADLVGIDVIYHSMKSIYDLTLDPKYRPCNGLKQMISAGFTGKKAGKGFYEY
ncbi:MAG: 3-hydroxyacyl-CoA dehydrogenase family protein [Clostridia bacterium]|nr:3-hydroxyacyl-CoA dehydrogenase family protein [Clostridia bacterium]